MSTKLFLLLLTSLAYSEVHYNSELKISSKMAYLNRDFCLAVELYEELTDSLGFIEPAILLNQAHAYFQTWDTIKAIDSYNRVLMNGDRNSQSIAYQQLGVIEYLRNDLDSALHYLKRSIQSDPGNEPAQYDFEVVKKLKCSKEAEVPPCEKGCKRRKRGKVCKPSWKKLVNNDDPLKPKPLSPEKVEQLLKELDRKDLAFIQTKKRVTVKDPDSDKPDW